MRITSLLPFFAKVSIALIVVVALAVTANAVPAVALVDVNRLVVFDTSSPGAIISSGPITGLPVGEQLIAIDYRPATGQLYAIGKTLSRLYVINPATRVAVSTVGNAPFSPAIKDGTVGFDFDPVQDRARIMVDGASRQNLTFAPDLLSGGNATSEALVAFASNDSNAGQQPRLVGLAYDNNFHRTTHSRLFAIHQSSSLVPLLVSVAPGNGGEVRTIGPLLNVPNESSVTPDAGFDISPIGGHAYVALKSTNPAVTRSRVYTVSLVTGAASLLGELAEDGPVIDLAITPPSLTVYAVNAKNELLKFNSAYPETIISRMPITGMLTGEQLYELDFRIDGGLYGLGRSNDGSVTRFYTINPDTGVAFSDRAPLQPAPVGELGFDFVSSFGDVRGKFRLMSSTEQNLGIHVDGNVNETGPALAYAAGDPNAGRDPNVVASAHALRFPGIADGRHLTENDPPLYNIDLNPQSSVIVPILVRQGPPISGLGIGGQLVTVGNVTGAGLPVDHVGFDIATGSQGPAFATFISMDEGISKFYILNLDNAGTTFVNAVDTGGDFNGRRIRDLAIAPAGVFSLGDPFRYDVIENCTAVTVTVTRSGDISNEATVQFETGDGGQASIINARSRSDYTSVSGTLFFAAGQSTATVDVPINEDTINETGVEHSIPFVGESFTVTLSNPSPGYTLFYPPGSGPSTYILIRDDNDAGATGNPIDDSQTFVCTQYHDFLNRNAEGGGLQFWTNTIEECGSDAQCREVRRINVSAAFFLSIEFQESGYLVYRAYQAAFGRTPVPLRFEELLPDTQAIGRGVVVKSANWEEKLEVNKRAFFDDFVRRSAFTTSYPISMTAAQFVDGLNANTGGSLSQIERDDLVMRLQQGHLNRAQVLRAVADDADFRQREFSRAFVLMQYFGYLRRNPDDNPDTGFGGYNFWLEKLNQFNGDFIRAEMVKAFILSLEYRRRFAP